MYTGETIKVMGSVSMDVEYQEQKERMNLLVVSGSGSTLMGRDWLHKIGLDWGGMLNKIYTLPANLQEILNNH